MGVNMRKVWIVVANSSQLKIYRAENAQNLVEHVLLFNEQSHLAVHDLVSDKQGQENRMSCWGSDTNEPKTPVKLKEANFFADSIAHFLEKGYNAREVERIYIIAKAPFLGCLRNAITPHIAKLVHAEINKDLTHLSPQEIREYLPPVL
jgi:protein required for attachment to host cells